MGANKIPVDIRIYSYINKDPTTKCWEWTGAKNSAGYGKMTMRINKIRKYSSAHRESFKFFKGEIPSELYVLHTCDNPSCVNPDHLYLGNNSDNQKDRYQRSKRFNRGIDGRFINGG